MAESARDFVELQNAILAVRAHLGSGPQTNIFINKVIIERPGGFAPPQWGVWVPSGGILDFVRTLYQNILDRHPENQEALEHHTHKAYQIGLAGTVAGFFASPDYASRGLSTEATVDKLYRSVLGRQAEPGGRAHHIQAIREGRSLRMMADDFVGSEEYRGRVRAGTAPDPIHWPEI